MHDRGAPHTDHVTAFEPGPVPLVTAGAPDATGSPDGPLPPTGPPATSPPAATEPTKQPTKEPATGRRRGRAAGRTLAAALLVFLTVVLVLFVVFNTQTVDVSLVFGNVRAPLVLALVVAAGLGGLVVGLAAAVIGARRRSRSRASDQAA